MNPGEGTPAAGPGQRRLLVALAFALSILAHLVLLIVLARRPASGSGNEPIGVVFFSAPLAQRITSETAEQRRRDRESEELSRTLVQPKLITAEQAAAIPESPEAAAGSNPVEAGGAVTKPTVIESTKVMPAYTKEAEQNHLIGDLILRATITDQGRVARVEIVRGLPFGLNEAAAAAVRRWRFRPATRDGKPVPVAYLLVIHFRPRRPAIDEEPSR